MSARSSSLGIEPSQAAHLQPNLSLGRVSSHHGAALEVILGSSTITARAAIRFREEPPEHRPTVGDFVGLDADGVIQQLIPRRSAIARGTAGTRTDQQILAANVDVIFCAVAANLDRFSQRIERYVVAAWDSGAEPVIVITKSDLAADLSEIVAELSVYGVPVVETSSAEGSGIEPLARMLAGDRTGVLVGPSGVGKSSLINRLIGAEVQLVRAERSTDHRGRHTTTTRDLVPLPGGGALIDTPGLREFQLWDGGGLERVFSDIEELMQTCRFSDCSHRSEPGCAVLAALEDGSLEPDRLERYRKLVREASRTAARRDQRAAMEEKRAIRERAKKLQRESRSRARAKRGG